MICTRSVPGPGSRTRGVKGVGGSTLKYAAMSPRLHESDFRTRSEDGVGDDWPMHLRRPEPYYTARRIRAGRIRGPTAPRPTPSIPLGADRFAIPPTRSTWRAGRSSAGPRHWGGTWCGSRWPSRPGSGTDGPRASAPAPASRLLDLRQVEHGRDLRCARRGHGEVLGIRPRCTAFRIVTGRNGRARGVLYFDNEGREQEVEQRWSCRRQCGGNVSRLLLTSASSQFPDGLANSSGLVGKRFTEHLAIFAASALRRAARSVAWDPHGGMIQEILYRDRRSHDFARGDHARDRQFTLAAGGGQASTGLPGRRTSAACRTCSGIPCAWRRSGNSCRTCATGSP